jgi:hypothetical protein
MRFIPATAIFAARSMSRHGHGALRAAGFASLFCITGAALFAQNVSPEISRRRAGAQDDGNAGRRGPAPQEIQARLLGTFRERLGVTDDDEWNVISERIMKVVELRRTGETGSPARGGPPSSAAAAAAAARGGRGSARTPEIEALQAALSDRMPDAEIRARLAKLRETRKANEAKLEKAQEDLRAVLTIRQEATAVIAGLLP